MGAESRLPGDGRRLSLRGMAEEKRTLAILEIDVFVAIDIP
jgi:hypothetical protein